MSYFSLPNRIIDKVEKWEQRHSAGGNTHTYNQTPFRKDPTSITNWFVQGLGILYIGALFLAAF